MKRLFLLLVAAFCISACGAKSDIDVKYDGKAIPFETKSAWITTQSAIYGSSVQVPNNNHALRWISLRNFDYEVKNALDTGGNPSADGQVKLFFSLHEEPGTDPKTPIKASTFSGANDGPMSLEFVNVFVFKDGKVETYPVSLASMTNRKDSEVKITSVTDETISGEINVVVKAKDKDLMIKGPFSAKILKNK